MQEKIFRGFKLPWQNLADDKVLFKASEENRILLTMDLDFARLIARAKVNDATDINISPFIGAPFALATVNELDMIISMEIYTPMEVIESEND